MIFSKKKPSPINTTCLKVKDWPFLSQKQVLHGTHFPSLPPPRLYRVRLNTAQRHRAMNTELRLSLVKTSWKEGKLNGLLCMQASQGLKASKELPSLESMRGRCGVDMSPREAFLPGNSWGGPREVPPPVRGGCSREIRYVDLPSCLLSFFFSPWRLMLWAIKANYERETEGRNMETLQTSERFRLPLVNKSVFLFSQGYFCFTSLQFKLGRANILWHGHSPSPERKLWYGKSKPNRGIPHPLWCSLSFGSQKGWGHRTSGVTSACLPRSEWGSVVTDSGDKARVVRLGMNPRTTSHVLCVLDGSPGSSKPVSWSVKMGWYQSYSSWGGREWWMANPQPRAWHAFSSSKMRAFIILIILENVSVNCLLGDWNYVSF